ncbi:hypothetical protein [Streptacidiphilus jiangxiensis]|uniref:Uncharacterized protein n=1 Tax=Streptacidiphilus jiangxiensis TaxID=235985 RepID=A0A1H7ZG88_STRJI|nr:hypothetical protein [Streptacidiphilus jiangxiensis]SEM56548.1 hypothetical protein SAMN05414137_13457 [Streptacidiphilus jiangxiensis]
MAFAQRLLIAALAALALLLTAPGHAPAPTTSQASATPQAVAPADSGWGA